MHRKTFYFSLILLAFYLILILMAPIFAQKDRIVMSDTFKAIDFPKNGYWVNIKNDININTLKGKIVLLDFWTYGCINCINVLPDLKKLEKKYKNKLIIIGIHSPKFESEKNRENIFKAVEKYKITHPVFQDTAFYLWEKYSIKAWPSFVLIDEHSNVKMIVSGENQIINIDNAIAKLISKAEKDKTLNNKRINFEYIKGNKTDYLSFPGKIDIDKKRGILYISDSGNNRILIFDIQGDSLIDIIGNKKAGNKDGDFSIALFNNPQGIVYYNNKIYVADKDNNTIREIDIEKRYIKTIAGNGKRRYINVYNGSALDVELNAPWDIDIYNNKLFIAMSGNHQIWLLNIDNNQLKNFAGNGREGIVDGSIYNSSLAQPSGIVVYKNRIYFVDSESSSIRYIDMDNNRVITLIGKGLFDFGNIDGELKEAMLQHPIGIEANGDFLYIADTYNNSIKMLNMKESIINTIIYNNENTVCSLEEGVCYEVSLFEPNDIVYYNNRLYIADTNNHSIKVYDFRTKELKEINIFQKNN